jgi:DNA repair photolyase
MRQAMLFPDLDAANARALPVLGEQKDIRYLETTARTVLNGPESTGMNYWSINPYIGCAFGCAYCYARYAHRYALDRAAAAGATPDDPATHDAGERPLPPWLAFERRVLVKRNAPEVLRATLRGGGRRVASLARGEVVLIGTATDPYQPAERRYRITRGLLEVLAEYRALSIAIITKSPLVTRDVDVLARIAARSSLSVNVSLITLDRELARRLEPRAPTPDARLRAIARLREGGIDVGVNVMPVLPGITDAPAQLEALIRRVAEAGAAHVRAGALALRAVARERYLPLIESEFPHLAGRYRTEFARGHLMNERYRRGLRRFFARTCGRVGIRFAHYDEAEIREADVERGGEHEGAGPAHRQLELLL